MADKKQKSPPEKNERYDKKTPDPRKYEERHLENEQQEMEEQENRERTETHQRTNDAER
ncbi:MAG: hypothetical protein WD077_00130 [Bacteroidia bacterium]